MFGRNYDWPVDVGLALVNQRGLEKTALPPEDGAPMTWISRYGGLTFNQYGRESPNGGINEKGLVIEVLWLNEARYAKPDARPALNALGWIQYQLDTATTIDEVMASDARVRIASDFSPKLHYLVCEQSGRCATVEFIGGKMVSHSANDLPVAVLANDTYAASLKHLASLGINAGLDDVDGSRNASLNRFSRAAIMVKDYEKNPAHAPLDYAFDVLKEVNYTGLTKWSIVYDETSRHVFFRTLANPKIRSINLGALDYVCGSGMKMIDMNAAGNGDLTSRMVKYSPRANRALIEAAFSHTRLTANLPVDVLDQVVLYSDKAVCKG